MEIEPRKLVVNDNKQQQYDDFVNAKKIESEWKRLHDERHDDLNSKITNLNEKLDEIKELLKPDKMKDFFLNAVHKTENELK